MKTILFITMFCAMACFAQAQEVTKAAAQLESKSGSKVTGMVTFTKVGDEIQVVADIQNLTPGKHGFHVHEKGDCSAADAASAGAHFNPTQKHHGGPMNLDHHTGDLGNIEADASGKAHVDITDKVLKMTGAESIIGHAVIVHEKADDMKTQPTGDAGGRLACGVIGVAKP
jgi:Cu-Zn family superoxide dismutase